MPRRASGTVIPPEGRRRSWAIRFTAYGERHYINLGRSEDGWNRQRAEDELAVVMRDVRLGLWQPPPHPKPVEIRPEPTFGELATQWFEGASPGWRKRTQEHYSWALHKHLMPFFAQHRLAEITVQEVDRYRGLKVRERKDLEEARHEQLTKPLAERKRLPRPLSNRSINTTIRLLATILGLALEYGYIARNPARGRKRMLKESKPSRTYLQPEQVAALLRAAGRMDRNACEGDDRRRQTLLGVLVLAGLRIGEALDLRWRDVDPTGGWFQVAEAKTDAGIRIVYLTPVLQEMLLEYRTRVRHNGPNDRVFPTKKGKRDNPSNIRNRLLAVAVRQANEELRKTGGQEIRGITPHSLRRTYISLALASGADVPYVMEQAGHADSRMTLGIYAQVIASKADHGAALDGLVGDL